MEEELFEELMESIRQGGAILRGEMEPSRTSDATEAEVAPSSRPSGNPLADA